jgi:steroid 5-alpha reductase family enzyme
MRLTIFLSYRAIVSTGDDFRFEALMKNRSYNVFGWTMGGCWCFIQGLCLWVIADQCSKRKSPLNISTYGNEFSNLSVGTYIGIGVFVIGLAMESIADFQKSNKEMKNSFIDTGLWSLCRHPNYLGENLVWIGMSITAMASLDNSCCASTYSRKLWLCAMSAIWSFFFLFNTSLMMLEKRADEKFKNSTAYKEYKAKTPILLPIHV